MRRRTVEVKIVFFDVFSVVAFAVGQAEEPFLQNGIFSVPEGKRKTEPLLFVGQTSQTILAPTIGPRAGMVVRKVIPGISPFAVILTDRSPLTLAQIGPPALPCGSIVG